MLMLSDPIDDSRAAGDGMRGGRHGFSLYLVDLEDAASVEEDTLRERGLARVDVR